MIVLIRSSVPPPQITEQLAHVLQTDHSQSTVKYWCNTLFYKVQSKCILITCFWDSTVAHVFKPLLVVGVLGSVSACRVLGCPVVCVKHVDEAKATTHFDGAVSCTLVGALGFITFPLGFCIGTETLWVDS